MPFGVLVQVQSRAPKKAPDFSGVFFVFAPVLVLRVWPKYQILEFFRAEVYRLSSDAPILGQKDGSDRRRNNGKIGADYFSLLISLMKNDSSFPFLSFFTPRSFLI